MAPDQEPAIAAGGRPDHHPVLRGARNAPAVGAEGESLDLSAAAEPPNRGAGGRIQQRNTVVGRDRELLAVRAQLDARSGLRQIPAALILPVWASRRTTLPLQSV